MHRRLTPRYHRFKYRVFSLLLDTEELPRLDREMRFFAWNRWGLFSFHDRDHGDGRDLNVWLDGLLADAGLQGDGARYVLCYPRILGYVFNPLSVWFCHDQTDRLTAIVYEVHNTYDERHAYVFAANEDSGQRLDNSRRANSATQPLRHSCAKEFYVSPFLSRDCRYHFRTRPPGEDVAITINEDEAGRPILNASFVGTRTPLTDAALLTMLLRYPLMTVKVVAAIHFEAVRLMLKGIRRHPHAPEIAPIPTK